jgi:hypothetical protein
MGDGDVWIQSAQTLHEALVEQAIEHEYHELAGLHEAEYWIQYQEEYLRFYARAFEQASGELAEAAETSPKN